MCLVEVTLASASKEVFPIAEGGAQGRVWASYLSVSWHLSLCVGGALKSTENNRNEFFISF